MKPCNYHPNYLKSHKKHFRLRKVSRSVDSFFLPPSQVGEAGFEVEIASLEDEDGEDVADDADGAADRQQESLKP